MEINVRTEQIVSILGLWFIDDCTEVEKDFLNSVVGKIRYPKSGKANDVLRDAWFRLEESDARYKGCILNSLEEVIEKIRKRYE